MTLQLSLMNFFEVQRAIKNCNEKGHVQQVVYSVHHGCMTQICFGCKTVRTSMLIKDLIFDKKIEHGTIEQLYNAHE